jgi:hypothetical protein
MILAALCATCLVITSGAVIRARARADEAAHQAPTVIAAGPDAMAEWRQQPFLMFMSTAPDTSYGKTAIVPLDHPDGPRYFTSLECTRVYFAARRGLCLDGHSGGGGVPIYTVDIFNDEFQTRPSFHGTRLAGAPSRARVAPDGEYAATTVFAAGDGYAAPSFSTRTTLLDMDTGTILGDLEQFTVWRDHTRFQSADFNFWGVTFSRDPGHFYATLGTSGTTYLIEGDVATQEASVLLENVECPSLSPDGTRLAFKRRVSGSGRQTRWQLAVLDLATLSWSPLTAESRSVDDQVEWLDDRHILYGLSDQPDVFSVTNVWVLAIDGGDPPRVFIPQAWSPALVR